MKLSSSLAFFMAAASQSFASSSEIAAGRKTEVDSFLCTLRKRTYKTVPDHSIPDEIGCTSAAYDRRVILNGDLGGLPHSGSYVFGSTMLSIPESLIVDEAVDLSTNDASSITVLEESNNRGIEHWTGTYKVLVVRVTDKDGVSPTPTAAQLSTGIFATSGTTMNSQFRACSANQLSFIAATGTGVTDGVIDVTLDISLVGTDKGVVETATSTAIAGLTGIDKTFTYIVSPEGPNFCDASGSCTLGYADTPGEMSVYYNNYALDTTTNVHEIGHNLGVDHSSLNGDEYADPTCQMGNSGNSDGNICFNAAKTYFFQWFSDFHEDLNPTTTAYSGELVPTNDVAAGLISSSQDYILKIAEATTGSCTDTPSNWVNEYEETCADYVAAANEYWCAFYGHATDSSAITADTACCFCGGGSSDPITLYVHYNKAEGIHSAMNEDYRATYGNAVTIYSATPANDLSKLLGALTTAGQKYTHADWEGSGKDLIIELCEITTGSPDTAKVIVYVDGVTTASCSGPTTPAPVASTPAPVASTPAPVASTPAPVASTPAPVASTPAPIASTPAPVASTPAPVASTPAPVASTPAPVTSTTPAPVTSTTPAPVTSTTPAPVTSTTPAPITSTTPAPVTSTTPAPVASTSAPVTSTTPAPVVTTSAPTASPGATTCVDSTLRLKVIKNGTIISRSCDWVDRKDTAARCALEGVSAACPVTCASCSTCEDTSLRMRITKSDGTIVTRSCEWVARKDTPNRCALSFNSCRATCGQC